MSLAYQVFGEGSLNVVWLPGFSFPVDLLWDEPSFARFAKRLGTFSTTLWFGARGFGPSGGNFPDIWNEEVMAGDLSAVLDTVGWSQVALVGTGLASWVPMMFAATHPGMVSAVVVVDGHAHYIREEDYPIGLSLEALDIVVADFARQWGSGTWLELMAPSKAGDPVFRDTIARCERLGQPPDTTAEAIRQACLLDVRHHLSHISAPTLVLHRRNDLIFHVEAGRFLADHIPGARYVELPGNDHYFFVGDVDALLDEVEEFLTGRHQGAEGDVVTSTILFTDIVSSTEQAARMGHRQWTALTDAHDFRVRTILQRHRGQEVKTIGDGFLARFDAATRAVRAAADIVAAAEQMGLEVRAGVHTGEVEIRPNDVVGLPVAIAKRVCDLAGSGRVCVTEVVKLQIASSGLDLEEQGEHELKGVPGCWKLFAVSG